MIRTTLAFLVLFALGCLTGEKKEDTAQTTVVEIWETDFRDDFDTFNPDNWQDQRIWVNNELQCYVPDGEYGTREVSECTLIQKPEGICKREMDSPAASPRQWPAQHVPGLVAPRRPQ